ncbi:CRAL-TRIO domain-containing protein [Rhodofomes roseus]|uniref:CRAL-TRIO domain-containing protein n=1 Tax=Rhodofomes roseus TaxID=34475 RepID=A0ABQ8KJR8_9APHY|nr:CRAL-TRIO domain-containing protein [Rhodofomes roseus]KAH9838326.1 CRAL-TRIO domain-containing protein [Rhodofomes roseus]
MSVFSKKSSASDASDAERVYEPLPIPQLVEKLASPPKELELTSEQEKVFDEVLEHFAAEDYQLPCEEDRSLKEAEKFWLTWDCIHRYCRAVKWASAKSAVKRLEETLIWRREYGVYDMITADHVEPEALTGKMILFGYDQGGRPALYLRPSKQNTEENPKQLHFVVWALERCEDLMGPGIENLTLMVDFADRAKNPSMQTSRATLNILQNHYPERLGRALVVNVPWLVHAFLKLIMPFVDPRTRDKIRFNPDCIKEGLFAPDMLMREWGGACDFEYDHARYWPAVVRMCDEHRQHRLEVWREMGAKVGIREWDIKGQAENQDVAVADRSEAATLSDGVRGIDLKQVDETDAIVESEPQAVAIAT